MTTHASVLTLPTPSSVASVQGSLALDLTPRREPPRPALRMASSCDLVDAGHVDRRRVDAFIGRWFQAAAEIAVGDRPLSQLLRHSTTPVYDDLARRAAVVSAAAGTTPKRGRGPGATRPVVSSVRTSLVREDAVEASAHVRYGGRSRAVAARFEVVRHRWQCVCLEWG